MLVMLCYGFCMNKTTNSDPVVQQDCCVCIVYDLFASFSNKIYNENSQYNLNP